jgi:hypothetical protein
MSGEVQTSFMKFQKYSHQAFMSKVGVGSDP